MKNKVITFPNKKKYVQKEFFKDYSLRLFETLNSIDFKKFEIISDLIFNKIKKNKQIFIAGNGGSAAVANHFYCDFNKGVKNSSNRKLKPKIISLSSSPEIISAISNDINFEEIFRYQIDNYISKNDLVLAFSCSGNSKNILNLIDYCKKIQVKIIFITGFKDKIKKHKNLIHLNLNCENYGITEDVFSSLMHIISQYIRFQYNQNEIL
tara:strand:- start:3316 stop:3942 length:627 start_codon:yes stop_codon:yes gene_type:complete